MSTGQQHHQVQQTEVRPTVRASLRIGRLSPDRSVGVVLSALIITLAAVLVSSLAFVGPSSAVPSAGDEVSSADRTAGTADGLFGPVSAVDAAQMDARTIALANAQQVTQVASMRAELLRIAESKLGTPYRAGAAGPNGFDCGGFTQYVFRRALGMNIGRSSRDQFQRVERIARKDARPGDLVFFFEKGAQHVGLYIGNGKMIDAPHPGKGVSVNPISGSWWGRSFTGIGRILPA
jgi:cell wall-associated NlpC family hydrolase